MALSVCLDVLVREPYNLEKKRIVCKNTYLGLDPFPPPCYGKIQPKPPKNLKNFFAFLDELGHFTHFKKKVCIFTYNFFFLDCILPLVKW